MLIMGRVVLLVRIDVVVVDFKRVVLSANVVVFLVFSTNVVDINGVVFSTNINCVVF
jgi:hypothetical protein